MKLKDVWFNIEYYTYYVPRDWYYNIKYFIKNLIFFRKELWHYRNWDFGHNIDLFAKSLTGLANQIENGNEEERSAKKKVNAIKELVELLYFINKDFGFEEPISEKRYMDVRNATFNRINRLLKGQTNLPNIFNYEEWVEQFDGTGLEGWWE